MPRDYRRERQQYYGYGSASSVTPTQRKHRLEMAARKRARQQVKQTRRIPAGHEVDHKDGNPRNNKRSNLRVVSKHVNRSKH